MSRSRPAASDQSDSEQAASDSHGATSRLAEMLHPDWNKHQSEVGSKATAPLDLAQSSGQPPQEPSDKPEVVPMVGPVSQDKDLRDLPEIPQFEGEEEQRLMRHPPTPKQAEEASDPLQPVRHSPQAVTMPTPLATYAGITSVQSGCGCLPPDTDGDVGPNHYVQSVNSRIKVIDKSGTQLLAPTTYNSFFSALGTSTPCGNNQNQGDGVVFYDPVANRWVVSDFAFGAFPGTSFYQCIGVSKTVDPVSGGWWLYALRVDPSNTNFLGDYPKFGVWSDGYYMSVNLFSNNTTFNGVRVYALPRNDMINGTGAPTPAAIAFTLTPATLGDTYSLLPATFRTGSPPPAGQPEYFMSINSSSTAGTVETQVFTWLFHADFATPANSTFGVGANHTPNGTITVNGFVDAFTSSTGNIAPNGTATTTQYLDTLGDKLMYPLVYQNLNGVESIYASHSINNNQNGTGPTSVRWYQFNVTGNTIPAAPTQQQTFNNGNDGLWRWMPSINVDGQGNLSIGYSVSSASVNPATAYAGRLAGDAPSTLAQGEATLQTGGGHQTSTSGRWGDYSATFVDPKDGCTFWHTNEYYSANSSSAWNTRIGNFKFTQCTPFCTPVPHIKSDDFNGNTKAEVAVWQATTTGNWVALDNAGVPQTLKTDWGSAALGDKAVPGDYDGDGKTDIAVYRPSEGNWYIIKSSGGLVTPGWGASTDKPVPGDYDGDNKTDVAVFRPSEGNWYVLKSTGGITVKGWGNSTDKPVIGDFDNDGKTDFAIYRPSEGNWYIIRSGDGGITLKNWGTSTDVLVPADYDGDGKTDFAVYRPSEGNWYIINSCSGTVTLKGWGVATDVPVPADYDGDGKADIAVWRPSEGNWYIIKSSDGTALLLNLGATGDTAIPTAYLPQ